MRAHLQREGGTIFPFDRGCSGTKRADQGDLLRLPYLSLKDMILQLAVALTNGLQ